MARMDTSAAQYPGIAGVLPRQRGNVGMTNPQVPNAILHAAGHGCKCRGLPARSGNRHTVCVRMDRWSKAGVPDRLFERLQAGRIVRVKVGAVPPDGAIVKAHPGGSVALGRTGRRPSGNAGEAGQPGFIWSPRMRRARWASRPSPSQRRGPPMV